MKVALVHDFLTQYGGAERFLEALLHIFKNETVDVYTLAYTSHSFPDHWKSYHIVSLASRLPAIDYYPQFYAPHLISCIENLDLSSYDLVFTSDLIFAKLIICPATIPHISYQHTPAAILYPIYDSKSSFFPGGLLTTLQKSYLRICEYSAIRRVDRLLTNSLTTASRIYNAYGRKAEVVYSYVDIPSDYEFKEKFKSEGTYFICISRLVAAKRIDLAIRACNSLGLPLVVVGTGPYEKLLRSLAGPTITFAGYVSDDEKKTLIAQSRALLVPGEEDLGLTPLEAMAWGKPVIAYNRGGVSETVTSQTGVFFDEQTSDSIIDALTTFENQTFSSDICRERARLFSRERFDTLIKSIVDEELASR